MALISTPWELVSVYKVTGLPPCVPNGCDATPDLLADICAKDKPTTARLRGRAVNILLRRLGIMAKSLLRGTGFACTASGVLQATSVSNCARWTAEGGCPHIIHMDSAFGAYGIGRLLVVPSRAI